MKRVLIIDTETSGIDATKDHIVELGWILYDLEHAAIVEMRSTLCASAHGNAAEAVNGIPTALVAEETRLVEDAILEMPVNRADALVAYQAEFDRAFVEIAAGGPLTRVAGAIATPADQVPWICAMTDIAWPRSSSGGKSLVALALSHGLGVAHAHRALTDCELIARLFTRSRELGSDLQTMFARAMRPKVFVVALVSFDQRDLAKAAGFQWDARLKRWWRRMPEEDTTALSFKVVANPERKLEEHAP